MNPLTDFIFTVSWFLLLIFAVRSILRGWSTTTSSRIHPEMRDVKDGEELMGITFKSSVDEYTELQERINQLQNKLQDSREDEDEDGGLIVRR